MTNTLWRRALLRNSRLDRDCPTPLKPCRARDLSEGEGVETIYEGDSNVDVDSLAVRPFRHDALAENFRR